MKKKIIQTIDRKRMLKKGMHIIIGLSGGPESTKKRAALLSALSLPAHMSANALLQALNVLFSHDEFFSQAHHILDRSE